MVVTEKLLPVPSYEEAITGSSTASSSSRPTSHDKDSTSNFACITMNMMDRLRMIKFGGSDIDAVREVIVQQWGTIQDERMYSVAYEFKLKGRPWVNWTNKLPAADLLCSILDCLFNRGWILIMSTDVSGKEHQKDSLFFRKQHALPSPSSWMYISWLMTDTMQVNNVPKDFLKEITMVVSGHFEIQKQGWKKDITTTYEYKLQGYPLLPNGEQTVTLRMFFLSILEVLELHGFSFYGSICHTGAEEGRNIDSWFFRRPQDWSAGVPTY